MGAKKDFLPAEVLTLDSDGSGVSVALTILELFFPFFGLVLFTLASCVHLIPHPALVLEVAVEAERKQARSRRWTEEA